MAVNSVISIGKSQGSGVVLMKKVTFAILGVGNRGFVYAAQQKNLQVQMEVTAIADIRQSCLDAANEIVKLPEDRIFHSADELLAQPKLAQVMAICTQDAQHKDHAIRAMELGYDLLLEKPIANNLEDIRAIEQKAKELGRTVVICHVLRFAPFYNRIKELLDSGAIGRIMHVDASECVSYSHMAHAYVRGHWRRKDESSPMILAKCSHDMDLILWLTGKKCLRLSSFGGLDYFNAANCPEGAPERCEDGCPAKDCPFHAINFYMPRIPNWPTNIMHPAPTEENILEILRTTRYGKCVFKQDNDVVDHQTINMLLEDGVTVTFSMTGFHSRTNRTISIGGTEGEIWGDIASKKIYWQRYGKERQVIDVSDEVAANGSGHDGGDRGLMEEVVRFFGDPECKSTSITTLERSTESHYVAFAAEESRLNGGKPIQMEDFIRNI